MTLDVYADIACPWCSIGEAHLRTALDARPDLSPEVRWRPFQLQPGIPEEGLPMRPFFTDKFGGEDAMAAAFAHVERAGESAGARFDFARLHGAPNTANAHRLVLLGAEHGLTWETARSLFDGYFAEGRDLGNADHLVEMTERAGVPAPEARALLAGDRFRDEVESAQADAARVGVRGVPFVVLNGRLAVSGAQPPEVLVQALDQAAALETEPLA